MKCLVSVSLVFFVVFFSLLLLFYLWFCLFVCPGDDEVLQIWILLCSLIIQYDSAWVGMWITTAVTRLYMLLLLPHPTPLKEKKKKGEIFYYRSMRDHLIWRPISRRYLTMCFLYVCVSPQWDTAMHLKCEKFWFLWWRKICSLMEVLVSN